MLVLSPAGLRLAAARSLLRVAVRKRFRRAVGEQLAERAELVLGALNGLIHRLRDPFEREQLANLRVGEPSAVRDLIANWLPAVLLHVLAVRALELRAVPKCAVREHGRPRQLGDQLLHRLATHQVAYPQNRTPLVVS